MVDGFKSVQRAIPLARVNLDVLFALRLLFDEPNDIVNIEQDINDLAHFPERLAGSYRAEWETYITRAIVKRFRGDNAPNVNDFITQTFNSVKHMMASDTRYHTLYSAIQTAQSVLSTSNTEVFNSPVRKQVFALLDLLPE